MHIEHTDFQDQLVRGLAHRMNNILTLFHGYVGLMLDNKKLDRQTVEGLGKIQDGARAASELMDRTHSLVRPCTLVWREIDLGEFVHLLRPGFNAFRGANTVIEIDVTENLPCVWGDMSRVKTAVVELVRNACEASGTGGTVRIEIRRGESSSAPCVSSQPLHWVSLTVSDSGPGIPPEMAEKIFAPFFSLKKKQNAAGLGLTVAQGFVQQLGGILRLHSEPGKTTFQILRPSRPAQV